MAQPQFRAGQRVHVQRGGAVGAPSGFFAIVSALPRESGPQKYRVRGDAEPFDRIIDEGRIEAISYE
ncbi:MAG: hypothetical protein NW206_07385 [Hyphomonadaceae bacterium]|nr:hypothetical protein [Hyphomonadaceae bacterium]